MTGDSPPEGAAAAGGSPPKPRSFAGASVASPWRAEPLLDKPAIEGRAGIAAPVLAGFSLALVGVIAQDPAHFRWPGATLAALMIPIFCLLYVARVGTRARGISVVDGRSSAAYDKLSRRTSLLFGTGICALWACIAMTAAPPLSGGQETAFRWVAFALAIAAGMVEAGWTFRLRARNQKETSGEKATSGDEEEYWARQEAWDPSLRRRGPMDGAGSF
jgi:hypothetical protein